MATVLTSRRGKVAFAVGAALVVALALARWRGRDEPPAASLPATAPAPPTAGPGRGLLRPTLHLSHRDERPTAAPWAAAPAEDVSGRYARPGVFDFATMTPSTAGRAGREEERFPTNDWFTREDLHHPELYFELAAQMPELNRPEERRDTLAFFLAYREQLGRDLEQAGGTGEAREEILAAIARYDSAIARLREIVTAEAPMTPAGAAAEHGNE